MSAVVLTVIAVWLVLSVLSTVVCTLVTRGGLEEDGRRGYLDRELALDQELAALLEADDAGRRGIPGPRVPAR